MNLDLLKQVNRLWHRIYPYLADQILEIYQKGSGRMLELGPFSGGISFEIAKRHRAIDITLADKDPEVLEYFEEEIRREGLSASVGTEKTAYAPLIFDDGVFDLVVCRGAFFFLDEKGRLLQEISRVLNRTGVSFVGGGFGQDTPGQVINEIADESRELNDLLGRKRVTVNHLDAIIERAGLSGFARIVQEGGLWVILDKSYEITGES
jgi:ubiquinone/menaquinone biosynthesis C-methylase UbiE